jgi:polyhydroxyalkanoate synthesis regulator phasin
MLEIKLNNMKQEDYNNLVNNLYKYYDIDTHNLVTESAKAYMKVLLSSTYGAWTAKESIQEKRSNKIRNILNGI